MLNMRETIPEVFRAMEKQVYKDICKYDGCFPKIEYAENLKDEVLENALNGYAKGCKKEDVIAICAAEQNGKKGSVQRECTTVGQLKRDMPHLHRYCIIKLNIQKQRAVPG